VAEQLRVVPHVSARVEPAPAFRVELRRKLMREAWVLASQPPPPWWRRLVAPPALAWAGAAVGVLLIGFATLTVALHPAHAPTVTVSSPYSAAEPVAVVKPIKLQFSQSMDRRSVQDSVKIQPATQVATYQWQGDSRSLSIVPVNDLAPNTRYQVTVAQSARTTSGQQVGGSRTVTFLTGTQPSPPPPTPTPTTTTPPPPSLVEHQLGPSTNGQVRWSPDGTKVWLVAPGGQLQAWPVSGGQPLPDSTISNVSMFAVASNGLAYVRNGQITYNQLTVPNVQPIAVGIHGGQLVFATSRDVEQGPRQPVASLNEEAQSADFSPAGDRLAYRTASGSLHVLDLASGRDTPVGPSSGLGGWSPDGTRYAYPTEAGVSVTDGAGPSKVLLEMAGVSGVSLSSSSRGGLLLATRDAVYVANADGSGLHKLQSGSYETPIWGPSGRAFAFRRLGVEWVAQLDAQPVAAPSATASQDEVVDNFMAARKAQKPDQALTFLDAAAQAAFAKLNDLIFGGSPTLGRYYVVFSEPGRSVVRIVLLQGNVQLAVDETLTFKLDANGKPIIDGVSELPRPGFGNGPEVVRASVTGNQVHVQFDSDLNPSTVASGVSIRGVPTQATYDSKTKTVTLTAAGGLPASGGPYQLQVGGGLQDVSQRSAVPYELSLFSPSGN
jgi:hypothetical protein